MLLVGGFFPQFRPENNGEYGINHLGLSVLSAVQMAINRINNKSDDIFDELLPRIKVREMHHLDFGC